VVTHMNFQICGYRTVLTSIQLTEKKLGQRVYHAKEQDVNDLRYD